MNELIRLRASSLSDLFDCPARWAAKHLYGRRLPKSGVAQLGTAVHVGTALYDNSVLHDSAPLSVADCEGEVVDTIWRPEEDIDWGDSSPKAAEPVALALHRLYCERVAPRFQYVAVEATCEDLALPELGITLTGTTDRVFQDDVGDFGIADIKTGRQIVATDGRVKTSAHAVQMGVYELLAEQATGKKMEAPARIIGLQAGKTATGQRAGVGEITGARELLVGEDDGEHGALEMAAAILRSGLFFGNPRSAICGGKYCPVWAICNFRK